MVTLAQKGQPHEVVDTEIDREKVVLLPFGEQDLL